MIVVSKYRTIIAFVYEPDETERKRPTKDPAGLRAGAHTLNAW